MTREEMVKRHWKPYMVVAYQDKGMLYHAECLLSAIDFDAELLTLTPIADFYEQKEFKAPIQFCSIPKREMKPAYIHGKKVVEVNENFIKSRKYP
jgi:hypothetical protein